MASSSASYFGAELFCQELIRNQKNKQFCQELPAEVQASVLIKQCATSSKILHWPGLSAWRTGQPAGSGWARGTGTAWNTWETS